MKIIKTNEEAKSLIVGGVLNIQDDITFECDINIDAHIDAWNINARNIKAWDINARNINAGSINARNIKARDINAGDINAGNIKARDIKAGDIDARYIDAGNIDAWNIKAWSINARDIIYYAVCFSYRDFNCLSIRGRRANSRHFSLDGKITLKKMQCEEVKK